MIKALHLISLPGELRCLVSTQFYSDQPQRHSDSNAVAAHNPAARRLIMLRGI